MERAPVVFISYSHDSPKHKMWTAKLAAALRENGIDVILDQWDLGPGGDVAKFMQRGLESSDRVLVVCTDEYVRKAEEGDGGAGYESMIVTGELMGDLGTDKFIPLIRQEGNSNIAVPSFLRTRYYVDFSSDADFDEKLKELLHELHEVPILEKPKLGKNPFAALPSGEEAPAEETDAVELIDVDGAVTVPGEAYALAVGLARRNDILGWRTLVKNARAPMTAGLLAWRSKYEAALPRGDVELHAAVDEAIDVVAPITCVALAGVESGREDLRDQRGLLDDLLNISGWRTSGFSVLTQLPRALGFVYHNLHGAMCLSTSQVPLAVDLAEMKVKYADQGKFDRVWRLHDLSGWPDSLSGNCTSAWQYIASAPERWDWVNPIFTSAEEYTIVLVAYYLVLHVNELATLIADGEEDAIADGHDYFFDVPLCFLSSGRQTVLRAMSVLARMQNLPEQLWGRHGVERAQVEALWPQWIKQAESWIFQVYKNHRSARDLPHAELLSAL